MGSLRENKQYRRGYRHGVLRAITWLHDRAKEMNDCRAIETLNNAAFCLDIDLRDNRLGGTGENDAVE